jgi:hypothetical protein
LHFVPEAFLGVKHLEPGMNDPTASSFKSTLARATSAVVQVGKGRGFIVSAGEDRYVITAAHCLPLDKLPTPHLANGSPELTLPDIIGPLASKEQTT